MLHLTFATTDLTTFCRPDELGLVAVGQLLEPGRATIECRVVDDDPWCRKCGAEGAPRDTVTRRLAHEPFGHRPTILLVRVRRYRCAHCRRTWRQDTSKAATPRTKISRGLGVSWSAANAAVLAEGKRRLIDDPTRFDGVTTIGVDQHVWRHTRLGDKYVTVIIDLTPAREKTGPARLLDMVEGRSKAVFKQWLAGRPKEWSKRIEVVAMDGFAGFKTAAARSSGISPCTSSHSNTLSTSRNPSNPSPRRHRTMNRSAPPFMTQVSTRVKGSGPDQDGQDAGDTPDPSTLFGR
ncbi:hypothetical protein JOF34_002411 [Microbacterium amylolyticum]|uniref:Transposase n=1 Tax=Microbacterium amylolyticum TaxID=936337 RepID=A0ABS4ZKK7_9MICO|nr:hypothetical protein [Microbacterium amylolyticum]